MHAENMKDSVLQCHVHNLPIHQSVKEDSPLTFGLGLVFIADAGVLFHSLLGQPDLNRGQPTAGS